MSNIEEDIKILKNAIKYNKRQFEEIGTHILLQDDEQKAITHILLEREQDKKKIEELEEENAILRKANNITKDLTKEVKIKDITQVMNKSYEEFINQFIPKQKVKYKMEKLNKEIKNGDEVEAIFKIKQQQILQELLEDK